MAALLPTDIFPSYELAAGVISIDVADIPGLTEAEANATTGNGSELVRTITNVFQQAYAAKNTAGDPPESWSAVKGTPTGVNATTVAQTYTFNFNTVLTPSTAVLIADQ